MQPVSSGEVDSDSGIDATTSPMGSAGPSITPDTEISPPNSPFTPSEQLNDARQAARKKLATLTLDEKACNPKKGPWDIYHCCYKVFMTNISLTGLTAHSCRLLAHKGHPGQGNPGRQDHRWPERSPWQYFCRRNQGTLLLCRYFKV